MAQRRIHTRGLISFFTLFGFIIMSITGLMLYVVPAGRVAYWVNWQFFGLTKTDWGNIHILSSILFIVAGAFHTYFNWKALMNYFKSKVTRGIKLKRELTISLAVSLWVIVSALCPLPPLSYLLDFNAYIKEAWIVQDEYEPPIGHAELLSLKVFAKKMGIDLDRATHELNVQGIEFRNADQTLEEIAKSNSTSPMNIYLLIRKFEPRPDTLGFKSYTPESVELEFTGTNIGNKSLESLCKKFGMDTASALEKLKARGFNASADQTLKNIAEMNDTEPIEVLKALLVKGYTQ